MSKISSAKHHHKKPLAPTGTVFAPIVGPTDGLRAFSDNAYNGVIVQESAAVVRTSLREYYSDTFTITMNGQKITSDEFLDAFMENRKKLKDVYVLEKRVTVVPSDKEGRAGFVSHYAKVEAHELGVGKVVADCIFNFTIGLTEDGRRQVEDINGICGRVVIDEDSEL